MPIHSHIAGLLGRYEYTNEAENSDKFWSCQYNGRHKTYTTAWGRNGRPAQGKKQGLSESEAYKKIMEKVSKGYQLVAPIIGPFHETTIPVLRPRRAARTLKPKRSRTEKPKSFNFVDELRKIK